MFDYAFCISLKKSTERRAEVLAQLENCKWKLPMPQFVDAIDGHQAKAPMYWQAGPGGWGCYRSHMSVLEKALSEGIQSYLLLEDDVRIPTDFNDQFDYFYKHLPNDWEFVFLGGQHLHQNRGLPTAIAPGVNRPFNPHRGHAYVLRGVRVMQALYTYLFTLPFPNPKNHIDHRFGMFVEEGNCNCYAADPFIIGQGEGPSQIAGKTVEIRYWNIGRRAPTGPEVDSMWFDTTLFNVRKATVGFGSLALNELGYDQGLDLPKQYEANDWQILSAHCASEIELTFKVPVAVVGCLNGTSRWHHMAPIKYSVSQNTLGYLFGPLDTTEVIRLTPGTYTLTTESKDPSWSHCLWLIKATVD
jgi:hypothetical protein